MNNSTSMHPTEYVIIGAGFAGASTAYHLARRSVRGILLLEQESTAGVHSSGRNAAMVRQLVSDPDLIDLMREGAAFLRDLPADWAEPVRFEQNGSLLLGSGEEWNKLTRDADRAREKGIEVESWSPERAKRYIPALQGADFDGALWCPTDGVVDIHALLLGYLKSAGSLGVEIRYGCLVQGIEINGGRVAGVRTGEGLIRAETVINAAGPWAGKIGELAGAVAAPLSPCRRHLYVTAPLVWVDPKWPFVWDITHDVYFRPESGGLLLCPCDQDPMPPGVPPTEEAIAERLAEKVKRHLPGLADIAIKSVWAGLRTLCGDGRFVVGWDPQVKGFFWVAGLGGHGVTASASLGALAASLILDGDARNAELFSPGRFVKVV